MLKIILSFLAGAAVALGIICLFFMALSASLPPKSNAVKLADMLRSGKVTRGSPANFYIGIAFPAVEYETEYEGNKYEYLLFYEDGHFVSFYAVNDRIYAARICIGMVGLPRDEWVFADLVHLGKYLSHSLDAN